VTQNHCTTWKNKIWLKQNWVVSYFTIQFAYMFYWLLKLRTDLFYSFSLLLHIISSWYLLNAWCTLSKTAHPRSFLTVRRVKLNTVFPRIYGHALFQRMCSPKPVSPDSHLEIWSWQNAKHSDPACISKIHKRSQLFTLNKFVRPIFLLKTQKSVELALQIKVHFDTVRNIMWGFFIVTVIVASMNNSLLDVFF
jgi:hypothetical protein